MDQGSVTNKYILDNNFNAFIMTGDEFSPSASEIVGIDDLKPGARPRQLSGIISDNAPDSVKKLLTDGRKLTIYFENSEIIIPAEMLYFKGRPAQMTLIPNQIRSKKERAKRVKVNKSAFLEKDGEFLPIVIYDVSKSGISFFIDKLIGIEGDKATIKEKVIVIVGKQKMSNKYFYRAYFEGQK